MKKSVLKKFSAASLLLILCLGLFGCQFHTNKSYSFDIETGDKIKVTCDTTDGYDLRQEEGRFYVDKDEKQISVGIFLTEEGYGYYMDLVNETSDVEILEENENDAIKYLNYSVEGEVGPEYNYIIWIKDSNTGIMLASLDKEHYAEALERLEFECE